MGYYLEGPNTGPQALKGFWWEADKGNVHSLVLPLLERLRDKDRTRRDNVLRLMRMYGNYSHTGLGRSQEQDPNRLRYNLIAQACDTLLSEITINEPKASYVTDGGDFTLKQAAKARELVNEAQLRENNWWTDIAPRCALDALQTGTGIAYSYVDMTKVDVCIERVIPLEVLVDEADARYGNPRSIYRVRLVDREVLKRAFSEHEDLIADPKQVQRFTAVDDDDWLLRDASESDLILVVQAWHLPTDSTAEDGRYVVSVKGLDLWDEDYDRDDFPFSVIRYKKAPVGWWGRSAAEELYPDQIELNRTLIRIQESLSVVGGMMLIPREAKIRNAHLTDVPGTTLEYSGGFKPDYFLPNTVAQELFQHCDRVISRALQRLGINEMATAGQKPAGLNSGEAVRAYRDQFSMRQNPLAKEYEAFTVAQSKLLNDLNRELYERITGQDTDDRDNDDKREMRSYPVFVMRGRKKVLKRMRWDESDLPENKFVIQAFPMSSLPSHPSGRLATVTEWFQGGLLDQGQAKRLLNFPDIEGELSLDMVDHDFALYAFETMIEDGKYVAPESYQNLALGLELMRRAYLRARIDETPESRLELVRQHMVAMKRLIQKANAANQPQQSPAQPALSAVPGDPMMGDPAAAMPPAPELAGVTEIAPTDIAA